jgi:chromosome partitioning protein
MRVLSIVSARGGAGKTTLALHLAVAAAKDLKVLLIDLDPCSSAERWHVIRQRTTGSKDDPSIAAGHHRKLPDMLKTARKLGAELVLIDTPPKHDRPMAASLAVATMVLVPLRSSILDLQALRDTASSLEIAKVRKKSVVVLNAVPTGRHREMAIKDCLRYAGHLKLEVLPERLSERPAFGTAVRTGLGVTEAEERGAAAKEVTALYQALWTRDPA